VNFEDYIITVLFHYLCNYYSRSRVILLSVADPFSVEHPSQMVVKQPARGTGVFSYVDTEIRQQLIKTGQLVTINREGRPVDEENGERPYFSILGPIPLPRDIDGREVVLDWYPFVRRLELKRVLYSANRVADGGPDAFRELLQNNMSVNSVLTAPGFSSREAPLIRLHSCCLTGEVFGSKRCDCGPQLDEAFSRIMAERGGAVVYMSSHEGRGIGLWAKAITYLLQDDGQDTYQANTSLGLPEDSRDFRDAAAVLRYLLKGKPIRLLSNNPMKRQQLEGGGQPVQEMIPFTVGVSDHNRRYLKSKQQKGHLLEDV
jgi:GTP cyclohydrolase II